MTLPDWEKSIVLYCDVAKTSLQLNVNQTKKLFHKTRSGETFQQVRRNLAIELNAFIDTVPNYGFVVLSKPWRKPKHILYDPVDNDAWKKKLTREQKHT